ncbi:hypothetical protein ACH4SP_28135 [Streptomyces sp. NPDC021093]|uniref:HNH endonuclease n=1 Tax=Streptomyces sp. NPDC021093 TaxID=3365112 RepID=UPI0037B6ECA2
MNPLAGLVVFQYNPDEMTRTLQARAPSGGTGAGSARSEALRLSGASIENITLTVEIDTTDQLANGDPLAATLGVYPQLPHKVWNGDRTELLQRLLAEVCELCGSRKDVDVHHIRRLKDLHVKGRPRRSAWAQTMAARRRKTLVVRQRCHQDIHAGRPTRSSPRSTTLESRVR